MMMKNPQKTENSASSSTNKNKQIKTNNQKEEY